MLLVSDEPAEPPPADTEEATVNALVLANFPLAILMITAIVGIPLWMTFKRPESAPDYSDARAHFGAKSSRARTLAVVGAATRTGRMPARQDAAARSAQPTRAAA
jgi:hypothetical protein